MLRRHSNGRGGTGGITSSCLYLSLGRSLFHFQRTLRRGVQRGNLKRKETFNYSFVEDVSSITNTGTHQENIALT